MLLLKKVSKDILLRNDIDIINMKKKIKKKIEGRERKKEEK